MAKAKSASPSRNARISRARQSVRTSSTGWLPPCAAGTTALRKPASPSALTRARQAASTSSCGSAGNLASAQRAICSAKARWPSLNHGSARVLCKLLIGFSTRWLYAALPHLISIALEHRLLLGGESAEGAREILGRHAQRLGHRLGLDRLFDRHRPFHLQHALGHGVGEGRPVREIARYFGGLRQHRV